MNKGIIIGVFVVAIIITGVAFLAQEDNESNTTIIVTDTENIETKSKSFEVGLSESIGISEP